MIFLVEFFEPFYRSWCNVVVNCSHSLCIDYTAAVIRIAVKKLRRIFKTEGRTSVSQYTVADILCSVLVFRIFLQITLNKIEILVRSP